MDLNNQFIANLRDSMPGANCNDPELAGMMRAIADLADGAPTQQQQAGSAADDSDVAKALDQGVVWEDLGDLKPKARQLNWNKSTWGSAQHAAGASSTSQQQTLVPEAMSHVGSKQFVQWDDAFTPEETEQVRATFDSDGACLLMLNHCLCTSHLRVHILTCPQRPLQPQQHCMTLCSGCVAGNNQSFTIIPDKASTAWVYQRMIALAVQADKEAGWGLLSKPTYTDELVYDRFGPKFTDPEFKWHVDASPGGLSPSAGFCTWLGGELTHLATQHHLAARWLEC